MSRKNDSTKNAKSTDHTAIYVAIIGLMGTVIVALISILNTRTQILLPASLTQTAQTESPSATTNTSVPIQSSIPVFTSTSTVIPPTQTLRPISTLPSYQWLENIKNNPIIPDVGMAGIKIGDAEEDVLSILGNPTSEIQEVRVDGNSIVPPGSDRGVVAYYAIKYDIDGGIFLGVYTYPDTHKVKSFRLWDEAFNQNKYIPSYKGITIGSQVSDLIKFYGEPLWKDSHQGCPMTDDRSTTYYYEGIKFWVCEANQLIYLIDIP